MDSNPDIVAYIGNCRTLEVKAGGLMVSVQCEVQRNFGVSLGGIHSKVMHTSQEQQQKTSHWQNRVSNQATTVK